MNQLAGASKIFIKQKMEMLEVLFNWEMENRYVIMDQSGRVFMTAKEKSGDCERLCGVYFYDRSRRTVMVIDKPFHGCFLSVYLYR